MAKELIKMDIVAYRDSQSNPTCADNFETGEICIFYRTQRFGCQETCVFAPSSGQYFQSLERREDGKGTLIPGSFCRIWKGGRI